MSTIDFISCFLTETKVSEHSKNKSNPDYSHSDHLQYSFKRRFYVLNNIVCSLVTGLDLRFYT